MTSIAASANSTQPAPLIRLLPAPDREPPFDDELPARRLRLVGEWDQPLPFEQAAAEAAARVASALPSAPAHAIGSGDPARPHDAIPLPDPDQWGRKFLIALLESAADRRPIAQLGRHTTMSVLTGLRADPGIMARLAPGRRPAAVRTVRCFRPVASVAEFSAVVQVGPRYRAIAARFEQHADSWRCVRLQIG